MAASPLAPLSGCARPATTILSRISTAIFFSPSGRTSSSSSAVLHRLPFSTSPSPQSLSPRTRGLRLPGPPGSDDELDSSDSNASPKKSRNEKKREARRAVRWGMELSAFPVPQIKRVLKVASLEREVFEALMLVKRLGPDVREGRRRQFNYIGRLLRDVQPELMDALIQASKDGDNSKLSTLSGLKTDDDEEEKEEEEEEEEGKEEDTICEVQKDEGRANYIELSTRWFDGLIYKDPLITNEVFSVHNVEFDRQSQSSTKAKKD
ncbi:uncharacterized protein LOC120249446 isoform X2 [Dioscorea cayenensis subsp. rotundata]|uniref:Uncharacterized protein LOC120249446 isoform X2 n=1 Tax=Dioscorea cayennensis subsp. rotundata TaxID=55577 RepID=A0AB40AGB7_DIOCR|nr:uncharacterized protein LOC120249446 isoform X2 [Dioscorea cayenensis subsp. rotundata]